MYLRSSFQGQGLCPGAKGLQSQHLLYNVLLDTFVVRRDLLLDARALWGCWVEGGAGFSIPGNGPGVDRAPQNWGWGFGKRAQLTDTIITIEKKLRSHFWQGLCYSDFVPLLGIPQLMWF